MILKCCCSFDLIYDAVGDEEIAANAAALLRPYTGATYVSIIVPLLRNMDANGVLFGLTKSACQLSTFVARVSVPSQLLLWSEWCINFIAVMVYCHLHSISLNISLNYF